MTQEQPDGRDAEGTVWGKGMELPYPFSKDHFTPHLRVFTNRSLPNPVFFSFYGGLIT